MKIRQQTEFETLDVVKLARGEWRISDAANSEDLLGFIERQRASRFEVVWMSDPVRWAYAETFEAALVAFGDSVRFAGEILPQRAKTEDRRSAMFSRASHASRARRSSWIKSGDRSSVA